MTDILYILILIFIPLTYLVIRKKYVDDLFSLDDEGKLEYRGKWPEAKSDVSYRDSIRVKKARAVIYPFNIGKSRALGIRQYITDKDLVALKVLTRRIPALVTSCNNLDAHEKKEVLESSSALSDLLMSFNEIDVTGKK